MWKVMEITKNSIEIGWLFGSKSKPQSFATLAENRYLGDEKQVVRRSQLQGRC